MLKYRGFTLLELLISLSIIAIASAISVPHIQTLLYHQRRVSALKRLKNAMYWARSYALHLQQPVTLCPSKNKVACVNDWQKPLILFVDAKRTATRDASQKLLRVVSAMPQGQLTFKAFPTARYLRFTSNGFTAQQVGTFYYCYHGEGWQLTINKGGRVYVGAQGAPHCSNVSN